MRSSRIFWDKWKVKWAIEGFPPLKEWCDGKPFPYETARQNIAIKDKDKYVELAKDWQLAENFYEYSSFANLEDQTRATIAYLSVWLAKNLKDILNNEDPSTPAGEDERGQPISTPNPKYKKFRDVMYFINQEKMFLKSWLTAYDNDRIIKQVLDIVDVLEPNATLEQIEKARDIIRTLNIPHAEQTTTTTD